MATPHISPKLLMRVGAVSVNDTLTSGVSKSDPSLPIVAKIDTQTADGIKFKTTVQTNTLLVNQPADAALAFGEHLFTYPLGFILPEFTIMQMTSLCPTGLSATAGEIGAGSVIASGANATIGAVGATSENIMEGTTISNHVAGTTLTSSKFNFPVAYGDHGATAAATLLDGTSTAIKFHANVASTWNQTAAENVAFSFKIIHIWNYLGSAYGED